jgi:Fe-S-cluster-containing dehydrogenase component
MSKWNLVIDVERCNNCNNCAMVVKDEYVGNAFPGYAAPQPEHGHDWLVIDRHIRGSGSMVDVTYVPRTCNHCDAAPCIAAGEGAVSKRADGIVVIDPVEAKGRRDLVDACPYGAIVWNETLGLPQHWIFDAHLLDRGWREPRCVQACPTQAMRAVKLGDAEMAALAATEGLSVLMPELGTRPRVYYRGLSRVRDGFVGGNVAAAIEHGLIENVEGAEIELTLSGTPAPLVTRTDRFGDFKIDGLQRGAGFDVRASHPKFGQAAAAGLVGDSVFLGTLLLQSAE